MKSFIKIFQINKLERINAINIHSYYYNLINPFLLRIFYKIPLLITAPGDFSTHQREEFMSNPHSILIRMFYYGWMNFFKKILIKMKKVYIQAINDKIYNDFINSGVHKENIIKIPNGISSQTYLEIKKIYTKETNFGFVGRLIKSKNIRFLLKSFKKYLSIFPNDKLYIFGKGPEDKYILQFIKSNNLTKNIFLLGFEKNKKNIYSKINVLILPTFGEGVPNTILEAILTNTFIIASKVSGIKDILDHKKSGLLFNPFNENDLIEQLKFFKNNNVLVKNMIENAKKKVLKEYDIDVVTKQIYRFLKSNLSI